MSFQAYLDNVKAKTGKTPEDFAKLAAQKGLTKHGDIVKWLKSEFALGHGHATAIAGVLMRQGTPRASAEEKFGALFSGKKQGKKPDPFGSSTSFPEKSAAAPFGGFRHLVRVRLRGPHSLESSSESDLLSSARQSARSLSQTGCARFSES
jgi:hypothetical protein